VKTLTRPKSAGPNVAAFIENFCRGTEGESAGKLLQLAPWQHEILGELFTLRPDGRRKYRQALIGLPRKNGKSSLGAAVALYLLLADGEPGAEVYSCAGDKEQARIVFGTAKKMVELDPDLAARLTIYRDSIVDKSTGSVYRVLSAEAYTKEGLNPSGVIFDELHVQPSRELWDVMTMGSGTRRQPLVVAITTAGFDIEGTICGEKYQYGKKVQGGEIDDPTFYFRWYEPLRQDCDWRDPAVWAEANPALGDFLYEEDFEQASRQVPEFTFRRYRLNQWTQTEEAWIPYGVWDKCLSDLDLDPSLPLYVGIDIALYIDSSAVTIAQRLPVEGAAGGDEDEGVRYVVRSTVWENPYQPDHSLFESWRMNNNWVMDLCRELREQFPVPACEIDDESKPGPMFAYDPYRFRPEAETLTGEGLAMVEFPQNDSRMIPASQDFYEAIMKGQIAHDGDTTLKRHVHAVTADQKPRGWRMSKPKGSRRKIDGAIAGAIAVHCAKATVAPGSAESVYETRGILVF
jgi:phage terminase large subunit-like protein